MVRLSVAALILLAGFSAAPASAQKANCDAILQHGLWNSRYYATEFDRAYRARDWFCSHYRNEVSGKSDTSLFLGLEDFALDFGFSDDQKRMTVREVCADSFESEETRHRVTDIWQTASDVIVSAWSRCKSEESGFEGVRAWINTTADPGQFDVELRFQSASSFPHAEISNAIIVGGSCQSPSGLRFGGAEPFALGRQGASSLCTRDCPADQVRIAFASNFAINGSKETTRLTLPPAEEPPVGFCRLLAYEPVDDWEFQGECVTGGAPAPVSEHDTGRTHLIQYGVAVAPPDRLGDRCGNFVCSRQGDNDGCGHVWLDQAREQRLDLRSVQVAVPYASHVVYLSSSYQRLVHVERTSPVSGPEIPVSPGRVFYVEYPTNNRGVTVSCSLKGDTFQFDPQTDFQNAHLKFVSRLVSGDTSTVNFASTDSSVYSCAQR